MILMTGYGQDHTIKENIRKGTFDFLEKPFKLETLLKRVENAVRMYELEYSDEAAEVYGRSTSIIIGDSDEINTVRKMISMAASTNSPALIQGETGTGKELIARNIHLESDRSRKQFISVNCASIPETLFESEFFGYEKGAFTG
ncbi:MAG: sigma-54-dependent Fis family transcriptional regulator, partial [Candidatus Aminicenantes bacterium]|nr:sigma-54-dependent Fis family transcriptional regulator [Candidatus Aminicenantes bacterium]